MPTNNLPDDPFDLDALRASPLADVDLVRELTAVPVRRPARDQFFRVRPGSEYCIDAHLLEHDNEMERATYWVVPGLRTELSGELRPARLFTAMTRRGTLFLWPVKLPQGGSGDAWHRSALEAADVAKRLWVKLIGNRELGAYEYVKARGDLGDPQWPDRSFKDLLSIAFKDRLIDTMEHPVVREINGDI